MGRPKYLNDRPEGRSNHRTEGLAEEERRPLLTSARLSDRKHSLQSLAPLWKASLTGRPGQTLLSTPTRVSDRGCTKPLLTTLLQLTQSEPIGTNRPGMPARKGPGNGRRKVRQGTQVNRNTRDRTLCTCRTVPK